MKKILVTGGAGFLGSHLCEKLVLQGHHVVCVDNYFTGSKQNLYNLLDKKNFEIIRHDICFPLYLEVDEIYNLACPASPKYYQIDPIQTMKTSILGSYNLLGLAKRTNAKILQTSTSEIYGDPNVHPQDELYWGNVNPLGPRSCYDEGKRAAECLFMDYHRKHQVKIKIVRIFNTYGPNMALDDGRVISNFIVQALKNEDLTIYGTGNQTRSFCYVDDIVTGITKMMDSDAIGPINLGRPEEFTIMQLADIIKSLTKSKSKIVYYGIPTDDPLRRKPNIDLAKKLLDWNPSTDINTGLTKTISYFSEKLNELY